LLIFCIHDFLFYHQEHELMIMERHG